MRKQLTRLLGLVGLAQTAEADRQSTDEPSGTALCPNCGRENSVSSLVCPRCENRLPRIGKLQATTAWFNEHHDWLEVGLEDINGVILGFEHHPAFGPIEATYGDTGEFDLEDVQACLLTRNRLQVELVRFIDRWENNYSGFEIALHLTDAECALRAAGLRQVFSERSHVLSIQ